MLELTVYDLRAVYKQFAVLDAWTRHEWSSCSIQTVWDCECVKSACLILFIMY
jgi:hypothetical protein